jgi:hypothetical protein
MIGIFDKHTPYNKYSFDSFTQTMKSIENTQNVVEKLCIQLEGFIN